MKRSVMKRRNFGDLPLEILEMIREKVLKSISMEKSASQLFYEKYHCGGDFESDSDEGDLELVHHNTFFPDSWSGIGTGGECDDCFHAFRNSGYDLPSKSKLMEYYGLKMSSEPTFRAGEYDDLNEYYSAIYIPIPSKSLFNQPIGNDDTRPSKFMMLPLSTFQIDFVNANRKLFKFVNDFDLKLYAPGFYDTTESSDGAARVVSGKVEEKTEVREEAKKKKARKIVPKWFIWNYTGPSFR